MIQLIISFGKDQFESVEDLLWKMKCDESVDSYTHEQKGDDMVKFTIWFKDAFSIYLFGHTQGHKSFSFHKG